MAERRGPKEPVPAPPPVQPTADDLNLRLMALDRAIQTRGGGHSQQQVIQVARAYEDFLRAGVVPTEDPAVLPPKPTPPQVV